MILEISNQTDLYSLGEREREIPVGSLGGVGVGAARRQ